MNYDYPDVEKFSVPEEFVYDRFTFQTDWEFSAPSQSEKQTPLLFIRQLYKIIQSSKFKHKT